MNTMTDQNKVAKISQLNPTKFIVNNTDGDLLFTGDEKECYEWCVENDYDIEKWVRVVVPASQLQSPPTDQEIESFTVTFPEPLHDSDTWRFPPKMLAEIVETIDLKLEGEESASMEQVESVLLALYLQREAALLKDREDYVTSKIHPQPSASVVSLTGAVGNSIEQDKNNSL